MCIYDICVETSTLIIIGAIGVAILIAFGVTITRILSTQNQDSSRTFSKSFKISIPKAEEYVEVNKDEVEHPYLVDTYVLVGESDLGLQAYALIKKYDEEGGDLNIMLMVKLPKDATNIRVKHHDDEDSQLGWISLQYDLNNEAIEEKIHLWHDALEEAPYNIIINTTIGVKTDINGVE